MDQAHHATSEQRSPAGVVGNDVQGDLRSLRIRSGERVKVGEDQDQAGGLWGDPVGSVGSDIAEAVIERVEATSVVVGEVQGGSDILEEVFLRCPDRRIQSRDVVTVFVQSGCAVVQ